MEEQPTFMNYCFKLTNIINNKSINIINKNPLIITTKNILQLFESNNLKLLIPNNKEYDIIEIFIDIFEGYIIRRYYFIQQRTDAC